MTNSSIHQRFQAFMLENARGYWSLVDEIAGSLAA
jgi:hypothetical protein